jgi:anti-anti-sigma factor
MAVERQITVPGYLEKVPEVCAFVVEQAEAVGLDERAVYHCQMAVDEWCTNVVEYGCCDEPGDQHEIQVNCQTQADQFIITIVDDGVQFDPTTLAEVDPTKPLEEREPGGLGWFFIRKLMDQVHYEYKDHHNHLTMVKYGAKPLAKIRLEAEPVFPAHEWKNGNGIWVVTPAGRLDSTTSRMLETTLIKHLDAGHALLIVDLSGITYISSSGLKVLVSIWRRAQKLDGNLVLSGLSSRVREVFTISGFDTLFAIGPSVDEAATSLLNAKNARN